MPLAAGFAVAALLLGHEPPPEGWRPLDPTGYALTVVLYASLVARRRAPAATPSSPRPSPAA